MIDLLNRIGFRQIAFGGEGGGGGGGGGNNDNDDDAYDPYEDADLYDDNGYQQEYSGPDYGGNDNNDNDNNDRDDRQPTPPPPPITYDPYEDASLYDAGGYVQSYSGPDYGGGGGQSDEDTVMSQPVTYTAPPVVYTPPDPVTSTLTATSPTDTSNLYDFYDFNDNNDEETVMSQPVTYTGPAVETNFGTDLVAETPISMFDANMLSQITNIRGITPPQTNLVGDNTQEAINLNSNNRYDFDYSAAYDPEIIPKTIGALPKEEVVTDGTVVSSVPKPIGPTVTVSTSNASNIAEGRFEGIRDKLEALGYTVSANGSSVSTADGQVAGENWSGSSTISNMLKENQDQNGALAPINNNSTAKAPVNTQTFGALPEGVTQQMITDSQNDGEYGYYNNDGSYVPKEIDKYNGGGPDYSGVRFASGGGAQFDLDGDRFITKEEMQTW
jgi:hypothetical protein